MYLFEGVRKLVVWVPYTSIVLAKSLERQNAAPIKSTKLLTDDFSRFKNSNYLNCHTKNDDMKYKLNDNVIKKKKKIALNIAYKLLLLKEISD